MNYTTFQFHNRPSFRLVSDDETLILPVVLQECESRSLAAGEQYM
jgi:hypothetical protein